MNGILEFIKEYFEVFILVDLVIFQIVIICGLSSLESLLKDHLNYITDRLAWISQMSAKTADSSRSIENCVSRIEHSIVEKKRVDSVTYWVDGKAYWLDESNALHPIDE